MPYRASAVRAAPLTAGFEPAAATPNTLTTIVVLFVTASGSQQGPTPPTLEALTAAAGLPLNSPEATAPPARRCSCHHQRNPGLPARQPDMLLGQQPRGRDRTVRRVGCLVCPGKGTNLGQRDRLRRT